MFEHDRTRISEMLWWIMVSDKESVYPKLLMSCMKHIIASNFTVAVKRAYSISVLGFVNLATIIN